MENMVSLGIRSFKRIETKEGDTRILIDIQGFGACEMKKVEDPRILAEIEGLRSNP
jgi:hypothetical protein